MDPTVVLKLVREQRRQINDTFNTSQHKQITSTNSSSISNSISPNQIFQTPPLPSPVQISSNSQRNKLSNNYSLKLPLSSPSSNSSSFSSQSYFDKSDNNNSNNSNIHNNNNKSFNHAENYFQINNNLNQSCISPSSSQQIDSSITRSGSVKSVASDSGVGSTSPLSDCSDYNNNNNSNNNNNNNPNNNSSNNKKNDVIVTHVSQQQKFFKSTLNGNTNNNQTNNNNNIINFTNNINNNILNNNPISSNGFSAFKQSSNIGSLPNQLYSNVKKTNNNIYDEYSNLIMQHKNSIQKSHNEANLIDQFNINTNLLNSKQQSEMIYHMQNQQNSYQHHQPQPNHIINPNHHSQHNNHQQHQVQKAIYPSQICDKECCNHLNKKSFNLINSFSLETANLNVNTANNPNLINKNNRPQNCDCKECNEMLLMNKKQIQQPKKNQSPNVVSSQYPPGYCDCPSCNIALAKMKSTQESKTNLPLLVAPTPIIPNIIPTNRFVISSNSSFSPIVQNSNLKNQYLQNQISLNNGHNNNNVNLHIKEGIVKSNINYSNIPNVNQDHTIKASFCSCPECLNINLKSQSNFYDSSYNNKDRAQLDVYNQKNSSIKKPNLIKPQMPNTNQNKLLLINNSSTNKHNNNININNKLQKSSSQVNLKNSVDNLTTAVLYANDYSDLADSHFIIKQKNLSYSEDANKSNKQVNKRKLDSNLTDNEQVDKLSHSHSQEKRSLTINQMFHQMNENDSNLAYKVNNQNISQIETPSFCNQKSKLDVNKLTSPLVISQDNLNTSKYGNDVNTDKQASMVCLSNSNDDDIELGEVVSIDKIQNSSDIINKSNESSSKIADEQENFVREADTPVTIPKKMFAFVSTRINDWLEKSVEFSYKLSLKTKIKMEKIFALLTKAWSKLLIINMIENNFDFYVTKDHSYNLNETETNMGTSSVHPSSLPKEKDAVELHDLLNNGYEFKFDTNEFDLLKEIVLFHEGIDEEVFSNLCLNTQKNLQDKFNSSSSDKEKFSKVLLFLKTIYSFKSHIIESLFCKSLNNSKNVYELLNKKMNEILAEIENENIMPKNESIIENCLD